MRVYAKARIVGTDQIERELKVEIVASLPFDVMVVVREGVTAGMRLTLPYARMVPGTKQFV